MSKTPQFDKALDEILNNLQPQERVCKQCDASFSILAEDIDMYKMLRVPPPNFCYNCRRQRRLAFLNYTTLYKRPCQAPDHQEAMVSCIPATKPFPVYDFGYYWSDQWDRQSGARSYDNGQNFWNQFYDFFKTSPQPTLSRDPSSINSDYSLYGFQLKNCYYVFGGLSAEDCRYSVWPLYSKQCADVLLSLESELLYECVYPLKCYNCHFAYFAQNCLDSDFIFDCRNCSHCFGGVNLRNKKYCWFNEQLTEAEYKKRRAEVNLGDRLVLEKYQKQFWDLVKESPMLAVRNERCQNVVGNYLTNCSNCYMAFWIQHSQNVRYGDFTLQTKDSMDFSVSIESEKIYQTAAVSKSCYNVKFSYHSRIVSDSEFLINCRNCSNCFGCIGLDGKKFCIFNKQYTEGEYWQLIDGIKSKMLAAGEYGDFLPLSFSPYAYNGSYAQVVFPLNKFRAEALGADWYEESNPLPPNLKLVSINDIPSDISQVGDDILNVALTGKDAKPYRIIDTELNFYRQHHLPIPDHHPHQRILDRFAIANNFKIDRDKCSKCHQDIYSSCNKAISNKVYCENCYRSEVV